MALGARGSVNGLGVPGRTALPAPRCSGLKPQTIAAREPQEHSGFLTGQRSRPPWSHPILSRRNCGAPRLEKSIANMQPRRSLVRSRERPPCSSRRLQIVDKAISIDDFNLRISLSSSLRPLHYKESESCFSARTPLSLLRNKFGGKGLFR